MTDQAEGFRACAGCPESSGCVAAAYCVQERRFGTPGEIAVPVCGLCSLPGLVAWKCQRPHGTEGCFQWSKLASTWFLVRMYARDEIDRLARAAAGVVDEPDELDDDDYEACYHEHDEDCYDYQGFYGCSHSHCFACGGCQCPGYCDDYQTYNLRPGETGGLAAADELSQS